VGRRLNLLDPRCDDGLLFRRRESEFTSAEEGAGG